MTKNFLKTFVMCRGLPASGKSTWAEAEVLRNEAGTAVRINRDLIREMLHAGRWKGQKTEGFTVTARDLLITTAFSRGTALVICDDTNLDPKVEARLESLAVAHGYRFCIQDFTGVEVSTLVERDLKRPRSVGAKVIQGMYDRYLAPAPVAYEHKPGLPTAVIIDIDGTLAHMQSNEAGKQRSPYDWSRVGEDALDLVIKELMDDAINRGDIVILVSGRDEVCRQETKDWLNANNALYDQLFMRPEGDMRKDTIVKLEIYKAEIEERYNVRYVLDDRDVVVDMWRQLGLKVLQVAPGNF